MHYLTEIIWYASWPAVVYVGLKFVQLNLKYYKKMERLEELESFHGRKNSFRKEL